MLISLLLLLNFGFAQSTCPKVEIGVANSGWRSVSAPDSCDPYAIFSCRTGPLSTLKRIRSGATDLFYGKCGPAPSAERVLTREERMIQEANRLGITYQELDRRQRAESARKVVDPTPIFKPSETSELITADTAMTTQVASAGEGGVGLSMTEDLKKMAKEKGVPDIVLDRAFAHYKDQLSQGQTLRSCFMAGDLTTADKGQSWIICATEPPKVISLSMLYGNGQGANCRDDAYQNREGCAKYFSNKKNSCLPMGGRYITQEATVAQNSKRNFVELKGLDSFNENAKSRRIGIHRNVLHDGRPAYSHEVAADGSNGCFVLPPDLGDFSDVDLSSGNNGLGMTLYVYPEPKDIKSFVEGGNPYWSSSCKEKILAPAWIGKDGDYYYKPEAIAKDQEEFINNYYQEPAPATDHPGNTEPESPSPASTQR